MGHAEALWPAERLVQSRQGWGDLQGTQPGATALQKDRLPGAMMGNLLSLPTEGTQGWEERQGLLFGSLSSYCLASTHVPVGHVPVWALAVGQHLPHDDAIAPHIAGRGELAVCNGLRCRPANGNLPPLKK